MVNPTVQNNFHSLAYVYIYAQTLQLCMTLCNSMDCRPQGSSVYGIFQATILEWVAVALLRGHLPDLGIEPMSLASPALQAGCLPTEPPGRPHVCI